MFLRPMGLVMLASSVFWLVLLVGFGFLVYAALRSWSMPAARVPLAAQDALGILSARYARGEVGREEYLQMRKDLTTPDGDPK